LQTTFVLRGANSGANLKVQKIVKKRVFSGFSKKNSFYLPHMEYGGIGLATGKIKKKILIFTF
jgi:hypothetical protein